MEKWFLYPSTWRSWKWQMKHARSYLVLRFLPKLNSTTYMGPILRHRTVFGNFFIWVFYQFLHRGKNSTYMLGLTIDRSSRTGNILLLVEFVDSLIWNFLCSYGSDDAPVTDLQELRYIQVLVFYWIWSHFM